MQDTKNKTKLHRHVRRTIRRHHMLKAGDRVGVAVSGGADSLALLRLLQDLANELGVTLAVLHFNHALRGSESDADEAFVASLAQEAGLQFISAREDVAAAARAHGWNLEDAARRLRYEFFAKVIAEGAVTRVAVAHTADDQAETVLARVIRGTGLSGLGGVYPVVGHVVRPLIEVRRQKLHSFLEGRGQAWREDASNLDTRRLRARLRHQLLPELERGFAGSIVERLNELARLARDEEQFWAALVEDEFHAHVTRAPHEISISVPDLFAPMGGAADCQRTLAQRLTRRILEALRGDRHGITAQHVEDVLHLASQSTSGRRIELPGVVVARNFKRLSFSLHAPEKRAAGKETKAATTSYEYVVDLPANGSATIAVPELGRRFRLKMIDWPERASDTKRVDEAPDEALAAALDADRLHSPLVLRNWRPGDAYRPRGRARVQKLKQLFLDARIAVVERACWPVLTSAGRLVWARGMPLAEEFAADSGTRIGLVIAEEGL